MNAVSSSLIGQTSSLDQSQDENSPAPSTFEPSSNGALDTEARYCRDKLTLIRVETGQAVSPSNLKL